MKNLPIRLSDLLLLLACLAWSGLAISLWVVDTRIPLSQLVFTSWDEYDYLFEIDHLQRYLLNFDLFSFFRFPERFGYGNLFFQLYALISLPFAGLKTANSGWFLFVLRSITLFLMLICLCLSFGILSRLSEKPLKSHLVFCVLLLVMPGLLLLYKPFSPDYLSLAFLLSGLFILSKKTIDLPRFAVSFVLVGLSVATKLYAILALPIFVAALFQVDRERRRRAAVTGVFAFVLGYLLANSNVFFSGHANIIRKFIGLTRTMASDSYQHAIPSNGVIDRIASWLSNPNTDSLVGLNSWGVLHEFFSAGILVLATILSAYSLYRWYAAFHEREPLLAHAILPTGFAAMFLTMAATNRIWTWYLIAPVFLTALGLALEIPALIRTRALVYGLIGLNALLMGINLEKKAQQFRQGRMRAIAEFPAREDFARKARQIVQGLGPAEHFLVQYKAPIHPVPANFTWASSFADLIRPTTKYIVWHAPTAADALAARQHGFHVAYRDGEAVLYVR